MSKNHRNGRPTTKLFHQNTPVIGGQKEFLPKQKLLLTTAHRRWSRGRWSEDRTPFDHHFDHHSEAPVANFFLRISAKILSISENF